MFVFKILGIGMIVFSSTIMGYIKSKSLTLRCKKLLLILDSLNTLYEYIEQGGCELEVAIKNSFYRCDFLCFNGEFCCKDPDLKIKEKTALQDFFSSIGNSVKKVECERIKNFEIRLQEILKTAQTDALQKCKIYQTFGMCVGLAIGILLI